MFFDDTSRHLFCSHMDRTELYCYDILRMMEYVNKEGKKHVDEVGV